MTDSNAIHVAVRRLQEAGVRTESQVLAWARGTHSGHLRYILELSKNERGDACGCSCISCGQPLQAVNAARLDGALRPHFRHKSGSDPHRCHVLSARAALLASLQEGDLIVLPCSRRTVSIIGLSGAVYQGWIEVGSQSVRVAKRGFVDATTAELLLDDGRRLKVIVTGAAHTAEQGEADGETSMPCIEIVSDDPLLATMTPEQLRARLVPALEAGNWCGHWPDPSGDIAAVEQAKAAADHALDWYDGPEGVPVDLRRESILHKEVKVILASAKDLLLPRWRFSNAGVLLTEKERSSRVHLTGARLEKKLGRIIPDVIAQLADDSELLVEITVTNTITAERMERIRAVDYPTLEIDFSRMHGVLSRSVSNYLRPFLQLV